MVFQHNDVRGLNGNHDGFFSGEALQRVALSTGAVEYTDCISAEG